MLINSVQLKPLRLGTTLSNICTRLGSLIFWYIGVSITYCYILLLGFLNLCRRRVLRDLFSVSVAGRPFWFCRRCSRTRRGETKWFEHFESIYSLRLVYQGMCGTLRLIAFVTKKSVRIPLCAAFYMFLTESRVTNSTRWSCVIIKTTRCIGCRHANMRMSKNLICW